MIRHPAHVIALGAGAGLAPHAPGTVGSLFAWLLWQQFAHLASPLHQGVFLLTTFALGVWACKRTAADLNAADPGCIVWDEMVAVWLVLWAIHPASLLQQFFAILLFRVLDISKAGPIGWTERHICGKGWRGALGVMLDDAVAAVCVVGIWTVGWLILHMFASQ